MKTSLQPQSIIFVSYKREDEARVGRLVRALEGVGLPVWWDRGLPGGENWRQHIQAALDAAKCVIAVWSRESVGPSGDFVHDEAGQAKRRGILVPVILDKVDPPLGFGEIQAINLRHWKGSRRDPFFKDLCAAVNAKLEGRNAPPAQGPIKRLRQRLLYSGVASATAVSGLAFAFNLFSVQDQVCDSPLFQPRISDACGALKLGHRPTKTERLAWEGRTAGSCAALRAHIERFPQGTYAGAAADMLAARRVTQTEVWIPGTHRLVLVEMQSGNPSATEAAARRAALTRARPYAERLCKGFVAAASFRFASASPDAQTWNCGQVAGGIVCGFEGDAVCMLEERRVDESETCGS